MDNIAERSWSAVVVIYNDQNPEDQIDESTARAVGTRALDQMLRGLFKSPDGEELVRTLLTRTEYEEFVEPRLLPQKPIS